VANAFTAKQLLEISVELGRLVAFFMNCPDQPRHHVVWYRGTGGRKRQLVLGVVSGHPDPDVVYAGYLTDAEVETGETIYDLVRLFPTRLLRLNPGQGSN
jgi:hypothetical protein